MGNEHGAAAAAEEWDEADVASVDEIPEGGMKGVEAAGRPVVIFRLDGALHAYRDVCPHHGARMSCGLLTGTMLPMGVGEEYQYGEEGRVISCPRHHWKFSVETGAAVYGTDRRRLTPLPVRAEDGRVIVGVRRRRAAGTAASA